MTVTSVVILCGTERAYAYKVAGGFVCSRCSKVVRVVEVEPIPERSRVAREPRGGPLPVDSDRHGTETAYAYNRCRCVPCRQAASVARKARRTRALV